MSPANKAKPVAWVQAVATAQFVNPPRDTSAGDGLTTITSRFVELSLNDKTKLLAWFGDVVKDKAA